MSIKSGRNISIFFLQNKGNKERREKNLKKNLSFLSIEDQTFDTGASNFFFAIQRGAGMSKTLVGTSIYGGRSQPLPLDLNKINAGT